MWGVLLELLKVLWPVLVQLLPLLVKWLLTNDPTARDRARALQKEVDEETQLILARNEDETSKREQIRAAILHQLLLERRLRKAKPA